jgi:hypothetical protein
MGYELMPWMVLSGRFPTRQRIANSLADPRTAPAMERGHNYVRSV